jgi:hypothetical protein
MSKRKVFSKKGLKPYRPTGDDEWSSRDDDLLLDHYLFADSITNLSKVLKRSSEAIFRRLLRLAAGQRSCFYYYPVNRRDRTGFAFLPRDVRLIKKCLRSKDLDVKLGKTGQIAHLARILGRSINEIENYLQPRKKSEGFFK